MCAHAVRVSLKSISGVDSVNVSLQNGVASVKMKPGNTTTLKQLNEAIAKNGFTMKDSIATMVGTVASAGGRLELHVSGANDTLQLLPVSNASADATAFVGKTVVLQGTVLEGGKGKTPDTVRYQSISGINQ